MKFMQYTYNAFSRCFSHHLALKRICCIRCNVQNQRSRVWNASDFWISERIWSTIIFYRIRADIESFVTEEWVGSLRNMVQILWLQQCHCILYYKNNESPVMDSPRSVASEKINAQFWTQFRSIRCCLFKVTYN